MATAPTAAVTSSMASSTVWCSASRRAAARPQGRRRGFDGPRACVAQGIQTTMARRPRELSATPLDIGQRLVEFAHNLAQVGQVRSTTLHFI